MVETKRKEWRVLFASYFTWKAEIQNETEKVIFVWMQQATASPSRGLESPSGSSSGTHVPEPPEPSSAAFQDVCISREQRTRNLEPWTRNFKWNTHVPSSSFTTVPKRLPTPEQFSKLAVYGATVGNILFRENFACKELHQQQCRPVVGPWGLAKLAVSPCWNPRVSRCAASLWSWAYSIVNC